jgi:hypothetical protein
MGKAGDLLFVWAHTLQICKGGQAPNLNRRSHMLRPIIFIWQSNAQFENTISTRT